MDSGGSGGGGTRATLIGTPLARRSSISNRELREVRAVSVAWPSGARLTLLSKVLTVAESVVILPRSSSEIVVTVSRVTFSSKDFTVSESAVISSESVVTLARTSATVLVFHDESSERNPASVSFISTANASFEDAKNASNSNFFDLRSSVLIWCCVSRSSRRCSLLRRRCASCCRVPAGAVHRLGSAVRPARRCIP